MASTFIAVNHRSGIPRLKAYTNATPVDLGNTFGTADNNSILGGEAATEFLNNAAFCYFLGDFYAVVGGQIYRSTNFAVSWTSVYTIPDLRSDMQSAHAGLQVVFNSGQPVLVLVYSRDGGAPGPSAYASYSMNGTAWFEVTKVVITSSYGGFTATPVLYHGKLYTYKYDPTYSANGSWLVFDPSSGTMTTFAFNFGGGGSDRANAMVPWKDRLFHMQRFAGTGKMTLYEIQGTTVIERLQIATVDVGGTGIRTTIFVDGDYLAVFYWVSAAVGWKCKQITIDTWAMSDVSGVVIPAAMSAAGSPPSTSRIGLLADGVAVPGNSPGKYIYYATNGGVADAWSMFRWNGFASAMTFIDTGGVASDSMPFYNQVDGDVFFTAGQKKVEIISRTPVPGGARYTFKIWGAGETVSARVWFCPAVDEFPDTPAQLSNASHGVIVGNVITGLIANGTTPYQVTWGAVADGFAAGDFPKVLFEQGA